MTPAALAGDAKAAIPAASINLLREIPTFMTDSTLGRRTLAARHPLASAILCGKLVEQRKLPVEFCVVAGRHHDSPAGGPLDFLTLVYMA
jgi:hypothetical protein